MESFYGGRQGASFVIKDKFKYISNEDPAYIADLAAYKDYKEKLEAYEEDPKNVKKPVEVAEPTESDIMATCLAKPNYTQTWYNEYCIIDTTNKNNPHNGKIYRRTIDTTEDKLLNNYQCAEYVGTIVGPSSGAAMLKPQSGLIKFSDIRAELENKWDGLGVANTENKPVLYDPSFSSESNQQLSQWPENVSLEIYEAEIEKGLVHGLTEGALTKTLQLNADGVPEFKNELKKSSEDMPEPVVDNIKYNWFNVRKNTEGNDGVVESWCYIGFEIPATSFTVEALHSTPGTQPKVYENDISKTHPFWYDLHFEIPGGLRGVSVEEIFTNDNGKETKAEATSVAQSQIYAIQADATLTEEQKTTKINEINSTLEEFLSSLPESSIYDFEAYSFEQLVYDVPSDTYSLNGNKTKYTSQNEKQWFCYLRIMNFNPTPNATEPIVLKEKDKLIPFHIGPVTEIKQIELNTETGHLEITYHNKRTQFWDLRYPKQITFTTAKDTIEDSFGSKEIEYNTGKYDIDYSCGNDESGQFGFVRKVILTEGENEEKGSLTFTNSIENQTQTYNFSYPKTLKFLTDDNGDYTGAWEIDYFGAVDDIPTEEDLNQFGFIKGAEVDDVNGKIYFYNTIESKSTEDDLIYVKGISADAETGIFTATYSNSKNKNFVQFDYPKSLEIDQSTGEYTIDYSKRADVTGQFGFVNKATISDTEGTITFHNTATGDDIQSLVYAKSVQMDDNGTLTYTNSASQTLNMGQIVFVDDVVVDDAHRLLIAYTDNSKIETTAEGTVELEGKTYINYGQTIGTLGVTSGPMSDEQTDRDNIDAIVAWYNEQYKDGMIDGAVSGKLHVVTTDPIDDNVSPISYFVMWYPDEGEGVWKMVSEIAGAPVGIPAQIGKDDDGTPTTGWTYEDYEDVLADGALRFVQMHEITVATTLATPWR